MTAQMNLKLILLPARRAFNWRALWILIVLYFLGNLAGIPLSIATNTTIEPVVTWFIAIAISAVLIGMGLFLASRSGLGAPWIEGQLSKEEKPDWLRTVIAISILTAIVGSLIIVFLPGSFNPNPERYPESWRLILASIKAGIVEEIFSRLILVSLFVWLGSRVSRRADSLPSRRVYWAAIIFAGVLFGWAHVDDKLSISSATVEALASIFSMNTALGILFGWYFWKFGLECAMLAHILFDAVFSALVVPAYLSHNYLVWIGVGSGLIIVALISWRVLTNTKLGVKPSMT